MARHDIDGAFIAEALGATPKKIAQLAHGHTGPVLRVSLPDARGEVAVKLATDRRGVDALAREGRMLRFLAERTRAPVPNVIASVSRLPASDDDVRGLLAMDYIPGKGGDASGAHLADVLSALHDVTSDTGKFGFDEDTAIGGLAQPNPWTSSWRTFFVEQRLLAFVPDDASIARRLHALAARVPELLDEPDRPRLGHGDLWSGNVLSQGGLVVALIDPALAFVDAEADLSLLEMFGVDEAFWRAYFELRPPRPGRRERALLYRLWPLLVHTRLFGGGYLQDVDRTLRALKA